ncbi:hypothetical protein GCM10011495_18570 [Hymenobacter frigidus]|uniref:DUF4394 domain-containing protein n=1 Tax=Hymenobacter frigidus TaxID=1524095 RepID=A0ABQ2A2U2_9BACT|nr:DUF4394 domain-containing protein [Hymenobacter frigidus]GGH85106.1 hypothetical protein GCM10011495_18570 [Hymenobacter frigidus]
MHTPLLSHLASRQGIRRLLGTAASLALLLGAADAQAQTVYGLGTLTQNITAGTNPLLPTGGTAGDQGIFSITASDGQPASSVTPVMGVTAGQTLVGMDYRPNTGQLFALGYNASAAFPAVNAQLYALNPATGVATSVGSPISLNLGGATDRIGFDFNPTVDRIRVVSTNDANYRLNPNTGGIAATDLALNYLDGTPANPGVGAVAYTNSYFASSNTTLYDFDELNTGILSIQNPPNNGVLTNKQTVMFGAFGTGSPLGIDLDVSFFTTPGTNEAFVVEVTAPNSDNLSASNLYTMNLGTGQATFRGNIVPAFAQAPFNVYDIAVSIPAPAPLVAITGQLVYGVTASNNIITFDSNNPNVVRSVVAISGLPATQILVGTDFRPNTGQLFGLGYDVALIAPGLNAQVYIINMSTGAATAVGSAIRLELGGATDHIGFDFNPTVDRIRVEGTADTNYRLNPTTGGIASIDLNLNYAAGDPGAGQNPTVGSVAYTNSFVGATATGLYALDHALGFISLQNPPNNGTLTNSRTLTGVNGAGVGGAIGAINDFDIYYNGTANIGYLAAATTAAPNNSRFYSLDAFSPTVNTPQAASDLGAIGLGISVRDISVPLSAASTVAVAPGAVTGQLVYAIAGGNLISFDSNAPSIIRSAVNLGAVAAGQVVVGADFRPATGQLFALGYNATNGESRLYTVNLTTGAVTAVGTAPITLLLGGTTDRIGFDFNPTVDRIRVISTNRANLRLNPNDGSIAATDVALTAPASAAAYTNNQSNANTTQLFDYDAVTGTLYLQSPPNNGVLVAQGTSGLTAAAPDGADFDIFNTPGTTTNLALLALNTDATAGRTSFDQLYNLNLTNGAVTNLGTIGQGTNVTGLAAFIQAGTLITWNGNVSTDWGTAANWTPAQVPAANNDVIIPGGAPNQPTVSNAQQGRLVTLTSGAVLTLANGGTLTTGGNFTSNGGSVAGSGTGTLVLGGTASVIGGTSASAFPNLTVTNAASTAAAVSVQRALTLNGTLAIGGTNAFTLLSNAAGTAYVVNNGSAVLTGSATVQRYIAPSLNGGVGYRHYSAPVSNSSVNDLATTGFAPIVNSDYNTVGNTVTPFPNVFGYNEARVTTSGSTGAATDFDKGFFSPNALGDALEVTRGYTVNINASALVDFTGTLNNGVTPLTAANLTRGTQTESGYHLRGNPFPSPLDWNAMVTNSRLTNVQNALYVFKSNGQYTGSYASYINGVGTNGGTNVVPVAQGFFVRTVAGQTGSLGFTNAERLTTDPGTPFQRGTADDRAQLTLTLRNATAATQTAMYFEQGATAGFDRAFDAAALPNSNGLTLATEAGAEAVAINGLPVLTGTDVVLPLRLSAAAAGSYTLAVDKLANLPTNYRAYLRDALTGTYSDLATTPAVSLALAANGATGGRYAVVFSTQNRVLAIAPAALAQLATVYPNPAHGTATLLLPAALRGTNATTVAVVDNLGRTVLTRTLAAGTTEALELPLAGLAPGVYSVLAHTAAGLVAKRLVIQ